MAKGSNEAALEKLRKEKEALKREIELASKKKTEKNIQKNAPVIQQKPKYNEPEPIQIEQPKVKKKINVISGSFNDVMKLAAEREKQKSKGLCYNNENESRSNLKRPIVSNLSNSVTPAKIVKKSKSGDLNATNASYKHRSNYNDHIKQKHSNSKSLSRNKNISSQGKGILAQFGNDDVQTKLQKSNSKKSSLNVDELNSQKSRFQSSSRDPIHHRPYSKSDSVSNQPPTDKSRYYGNKIQGNKINHKHINNGIKSSQNISEKHIKRGIAAQNGLSTGINQQNNAYRDSKKTLKRSISENAVPQDNDRKAKSTQNNVVTSRNNIKDGDTNRSCERKGIMAQNDRSITAQNSVARGINAQSGRGIVSQNNVSRGIKAQSGRGIEAQNSIPKGVKVQGNRGIAAQNCIPSEIKPSGNRGIAAQNGIPRGIMAQNYRGIAVQNANIVSASKGSSKIMTSSRYMDDSEDEYDEEMDDFIDDSEDVIDDKIRASIYKSLRFNPEKYAKVSKYDDCRNMESNLEHIMKEEKRSAYLAKKEDEEELRQEEDRLRKKRKMFVDD